MVQNHMLQLLSMVAMEPPQTVDVYNTVEIFGVANRVLVLEEGPETGGWAADVLAAITHDALDDLDDAWRLTTPDIPVPYSPPLEDAHFPGRERIVESVLERLAVG